MIPACSSVATAGESHSISALLRDASRADFWANYQAFRAAYDLDGLDLGPELFADVRDRSLGPETIQFDSSPEMHP
jgi:hypothetical protein